MKCRFFLLGFLVLLFLCTVGAFVRTEAARASTTFTVDRTDDNASAMACTVAPNDCSLRGAIIAANAIAGDVTILLPSGTYTLTISGTGEENAATGDLDITSSVVISATGTTRPVIDGNGSVLNDRVFHIVTNTTAVNIYGVIIQGGAVGSVADPMPTRGGGIWISSGGALTLTNSVVRGNVASGGGGIAISDGGALTLRDSTVSSNNATFGTGCGGIDNFGTVAVDNSIISGNNGTSGGGIFNGGTLTITNSTISSNSASDGGGILNNSVGTVTVINSTVNGNNAGQGGGIHNVGILTIINSTISSNNAVIGGGGINNYLSHSLVNLNSVTISHNVADSDRNGYGDGGGINTSGILTFSNTIIANNIGAGGQASDCLGTLTSQGYNLIRTATGCAVTGVATGNLTGVEPNLGPLQDNGGPTFTRALSPGSPAIDAGNPAGCTDSAGNPLVADQRGRDRAVDGNKDNNAVCDIGAYEFDLLNNLYLPLISR